MNAWETLISGSTIATGNAWEHLEAQGGGGTGIIIVHADGMEVEIAMDDIEITIDQSEIDVAIDQSEVEVEINNDPLEVEI